MEQEIKAQLDRIESLLMSVQKNILNLEEVAELTGYSKQGIYGLCSNRKIPHYKQGHKLYFKRKEIEAWMTAKRVSTQAEIESKAALYCHTH
jgi:excisionase family DNA binding protein